MNKQSNLYIIIYSTVLVVVVATLLALASTLLKPYQQKNIETEKKLDILKSVGRATEAEKVKDKHTYVGDEFNSVIVEQFVVNHKGSKVEGVDPFTVDLKVQFAKPVDEQVLPVFVANVRGDELKYIIPLLGGGLWGPVWGYISLNDDFNTIYGAAFAHKSETPGLGAEIANAEFQQQFIGKKIFKNNKFVSISVVKVGTKSDADYSVDGISGGTITSQGVEAMVHDCLINYQEFFKKSLEESKSKEISHEQHE